MSLTSGEIAICNAALMKIGSGKLIVVDGESTNEFNCANALYSMARDYVLASGNWDFATKRAALANQVASTYTLWAYQYDYPTDCLRARRILGAGAERRDEELPYQIVNTGTAKKVLTNTASASLEYVVKVTDTALFPPLFSNALAYYLAAELATALKASAELGKNALDAFSALLKQAAQPELHEGMREAAFSQTTGTTYTHIAICNMALSRIGAKVTIESLDEHTDAARACALHFSESVSAALRAPWPWATKRATLTEVPAKRVTNWTYAYTMPSDVAFVQGLVNPYGRKIRQDQVMEYELGFEDSDNTTMIYCDLEEAELLYTSTNVDVNSFDVGFRDALAWKIAAEIGPSLGADIKHSIYCRQMYKMSIDSAMAQAFNESEDGPDATGEFFNARS